MRRYRMTGIKRFWIVESSDEVLGDIERLEKEGGVWKVGSFDFSTLYTMIAHDSLKEELYRIIYDAFMIAGKQKIAIYSKSASFVDDAREGTETVCMITVTRMICLLIDNMYVTYGESVYRQCVGVPMGTDCAPFLANLYLFALESKWIDSKVAAGELELARKFGGVSRYIDDLLVMNGEGLIETYGGEIYGGLAVTKENEVDYKTHFLDLNLLVNDGRIMLSTYDKRDAFPFAVRSYPDLSGNIHTGQAHGVIVGQLRRFGKSNRHFSHFRSRVQSLTSQLLSQGFNRDRLREYCKKFATDSWHIVGKYGRSAEEWVRECFA
jgi:hypothetical protein